MLILDKFDDYDDLEPGNYICAEHYPESKQDFYGPIEWLQITYEELRDTGAREEDNFGSWDSECNLWAIHRDEGVEHYTDICLITVY